MRMIIAIASVCVFVALGFFTQLTPQAGAIVTLPSLAVNDPHIAADELQITRIAATEAEFRQCIAWCEGKASVSEQWKLGCGWGCGAAYDDYYCRGE